MESVSISIDPWKGQELLTKVHLQEIVGTDTSVENHGGRVWRKAPIPPSQGWHITMIKHHILIVFVLLSNRNWALVLSSLQE